MWAFAIVVEVNQIGVATTLVNTLFRGFVGALALAAGLAFGLGGRDTAAQDAKSKLERAANAAGELADQKATDLRHAATRRDGRQ